MKKINFIDTQKPPIRNVILDFGGVIVDIDYNQTKIEFEKLGINDFDKIFSQFTQSSLSTDFETGKISPAEFRKNLHQIISNPEITDTQLDNAWNAMILNFDEKRMLALDAIKSKYKLFLFSNTNEIHVDFCYRHRHLGEIAKRFEKIYLSNQIHCHKPDVEAFDFVVRDAKINASETLFIDDTLPNIEGARKAGLQAYHLHGGETINDLFCD